MILTAVPKVAIHFGTERRALDGATLQEIRVYHVEGHFPAGAWTKIDAAIRL